MSLLSGNTMFQQTKLKVSITAATLTLRIYQLCLMKDILFPVKYRFSLFEKGSNSFLLIFGSAAIDGLSLFEK